MMVPDYIPVQDNPYLVREKKSGAILSTDKNGLEVYRNARAERLKAKNEMVQLKSELAEVKSLLLELLNKKQ